MLFQQNKLEEDRLVYLRENGITVRNIVCKSDAWLINANELISFYKQNQSLPSSRTKLGNFAHRIARLYRSNELAKEQADYLFKGGVDLSLTRNNIWYKHAEKLIAYYKENEKLPHSKTMLGKFYSRFQIDFKKDRVSKERIEYLQKNNIPIKVKVSKYQQWVNSADAFILEYKKHKLIKTMPSNFRKWFYYYKSVFVNDKLSKEKYDYLKSKRC